MQKLAWEATAATEPALAAAAKAGPCSIARNAATGAEVSGSPASQPPKASPQRRATQSAARITNGVRINLVSNRFTATRGFLECAMESTEAMISPCGYR